MASYPAKDFGCHFTHKAILQIISLRVFVYKQLIWRRRIFMPTLLELVNGKNYFTANRVIGKILGNNTAIFLNELVDVYDLFNKQEQLVNKEGSDGWFYWSSQKVQERTNLSPYQQRSCIKKLIYEQIIKYHICPYTSQRYFYIDKAYLCVLISKDEKRDKIIQKSVGDSSSSRPRLKSLKTGGLSSFTPIMDKEPISMNLDHEPEKDNVSHAATQKKYKTLDPAKRYRLDEQQAETLKWLQSLGLAVQIQTLCYWAKTYSFERLSDVYRETCRRRPENFGKYINKLLTTKAIVRTPDAAECAKVAEDYKAATNWFALKIGSKYVTFDLGKSKEEIPLAQKPEDFLRQLIEKHKLITTNRY